jgi:LmbE family N-acetylglucosaminyl deacetylase
VTAALFDGSPPWYVPDSPLPSARRLAVVAPHPDDFDVIAVTLRHFQRASAQIAVAVLASGASGVDDGFVTEAAPDAKRRIREREQEASCAFFGLPEGQLHFLRLAEDASGHLSDGTANSERVSGFLARWQPEFVFLPHGNDPNLAHQRTFAMVADALSRQRSAATMWLNRDPKTIAMREDVYVVFDDDAAAWKRALLRHHASQQARNLRVRGQGFDDRILLANAKTASSAGRPDAFAETFELREAR